MVQDNIWLDLRWINGVYLFEISGITLVLVLYCNASMHAMTVGNKNKHLKKRMRGKKQLAEETGMLLSWLAMSTSQTIGRNTSWLRQMWCTNLKQEYDKRSNWDLNMLTEYRVSFPGIFFLFLDQESLLWCQQRVPE